MAKIIDIGQRNITRVGSQAELMKRWEASLPPEIKAARKAAQETKDLKRQLTNAKARQRRAAMARSNPPAGSAGGGGGAPQVSRSSEAPRAASVNVGNMSGSARPRRSSRVN